jgi:hypothetical protein
MKKPLPSDVNEGEASSRSFHFEHVFCFSRSQESPRGHAIGLSMGFLLCARSYGHTIRFFEMESDAVIGLENATSLMEWLLAETGKSRRRCIWVKQPEETRVSFYGQGPKLQTSSVCTLWTVTRTLPTFGHGPLAMWATKRERVSCRWRI